MEILQFLLLGVEVVISILLVLIILVQKTKSGGGMGAAFGGGGGAETIFGSRAGNVLTKATIVLGTVFLLNTLFLAVLFANKSESLLIDAETMATFGEVPKAPSSTVSVPPPEAGVPSGEALAVSVEEAVAPVAEAVAPVVTPVEPGE